MPRPSVEAERRKQILDAACTVLAKRGLQDLRLSEVAETAGVSSGTIHYYFDTKKDVVNAAFEHNFASSLDRRQWLYAQPHEPLELLGEIVVSYLPVTKAAQRAWRVWAELWAEGIRDPALQKVNDRLYGQWRDLVADTIAAAQRAGTARDGDPVRLANMLIGMLDGLVLQVLLRSKNLSLRAARETCLSFVDELVAAPPRAG